MTAMEMTRNQPQMLIPGQIRLYLRFLSHFQRIIDLDAQIPDRAFQLGMAQKELHSP